ncbi:MAG: peptidylprolyl isomerase [Bdellovibrionota bacterium]|nr:MAG: peptidylprolyl isomerase [Pseudomonadota bacterium]
MADMKQQVKEIEKTIDFTKTKYEVNLDTNLGLIRLETFPDQAPGHVKNLISLTKAGFYNGVGFHRIIKGFMIQGGCPQGTGTGGPGYQIPAEFNNILHEPGVLSMARTSDPNSAGSQFFICLERVPYLDGQYTVFGKAMDKESLDVVKAIGAVRTGPQDRPVEPVVITKATVIEKPLS